MNDFEPQDLSWIEKVGERFEQAWEKGEQPRIEDFLKGVPEPEQADVLRYLVSIELERRRALGERPEPEEYKKWFAKYRELVGEVFHRGATLSLPSKVNPQATGVANTISDRGRQGDCQLPSQIGRFQIRALLGAGAFGTVYRAYDPQLDREVALKVPQAGTLDSPKRTERFLREAKSAAQLRHPHIVPVYDAGHDGHNYYIASAFIQGHTLAEAIDDGKVDLRHAVQIVRDLAEALAYAQELGIVHRDVKPDNIMLDERGQSHLMDFGLAQRQDSVEKKQSHLEELKAAPAHDASPKLTQAGTVMGTAAYMSPEQAAGRITEVGPASDQYSLGVVLYELLCGQTPFAGPLKIVLFNVIHTPPPAPRAVKTEVPLDLETICLKAMSKQPEDRYANCQELADDLRRWLEGEPIQARRLGRIERLVRWCKREPALAITGAVAAACLIAVALVSTVSAIWMDASAERERIAKDEAIESQKAEASARERAVSDSYFLGIALADRELRDKSVAGAEKILDKCPVSLRGWEWDHLKGRCQKELLTAGRRKEGGNTVAYSPDGTRLALGNKDGTVTVWDPNGDVKPLTLRAHDGEIHCLAFSQDNQRLATGSSNGTVTIWDVTGVPTVLFTRREHLQDVTSVAFDREGKWLASGSLDKTVKVWDMTTRQPVRTLKHSDQVVLVVFTPPLGGESRSPLVCAAGHNTVKVWDATTWDEIKLPGFTTGAVSSDGRRFALAIPDGTVKVTKAITGESRPFTDIHDGRVHSMAMSRDGRRIASGDDQIVKVWDTDSGTVVGAFKGTADFSLRSDGQKLASAAEPGTVRIWDLEQRAGVMLNPEGKRIPLSTQHVTVPGEHATQGKAPTLLGYANHLTSVAFGSGRWLATAGRFYNKEMLLGGEVKVWDVDTDEEVFTLEKSSIALVRCVAFSCYGNRLGAGSWDGTVRVWDIDTHRICRLRKLTGEITSVAFSPDERFLAVASTDKTVKIWDLISDEVRTIGEHTDAVNSVAFSPDGRFLFTGSEDKIIKKWDRGTGRVSTFSGNVAGVNSIAVSPDGKSLASAGSDKTVRVWNIDTGKQLFLGQHDEKTTSVAFSPDGDRLASASIDRSVKIWDINNGRQALSLKGETGFNYAVFSPDGQYLAAGSERGIKIWQASSTPTPDERQEVGLSFLEAVDEPRNRSEDTHFVKYLPDNTEFVLFVNVRQIVDAPLFQKHLRGPLKEMLTSNDKVWETLDRLGFDPFRDLISLTAAFSGIGSDVKGLVIARGQFDRATFEAVADRVAQLRGDNLQIHEEEGQKVYQIGLPYAQPIFAAIVDKKTIVLSNEKSYVLDTFARADGTKKSQLKPELHALIQKQDANQSLWLVASSDAWSKLPPPNDDAGKRIIDNTESITVGLTIAKDVKFSMTFAAKSADAAKEVEEGLKSGLDMFKAILAMQGGMGLPVPIPIGPIVDLAGSAKISKDGTNVILRSEVSEELIEKALKPGQIDRLGRNDIGFVPPKPPSKPPRERPRTVVRDHERILEFMKAKDIGTTTPLKNMTWSNPEAAISNDGSGQKGTLYHLSGTIRIIDTNYFQWRTVEKNYYFFMDDGKVLSWEKNDNGPDKLKICKPVREYSLPPNLGTNSPDERQSSEPSAEPPARRYGTPLGAEKSSAKAVIDKAIAAAGREAKLTKAKAVTYKAKGTYHAIGNAIPYTLEHALQLPTQYRASIEAENFKIVVVANGDKGWVKINGELQERDKDKIAEQKETLHAALVGSLVPLKDKAFTLSPLGDAKVGDQEAVGVKVSHKDRRDVNLYFDKKTGLLIKMEHGVKDDQMTRVVRK